MRRIDSKLISISAIAATAVGCGGVDPLSTAASVQITPAAGLIIGIDETQQFTALVHDASGAILSAPFLIWRSSDLAVATIDANSGLARAKAVGTAEIKATSGSANGTASLEVYVDPNTSFASGEVKMGRNGYTEYDVGDLPIIIAASHGGSLTPEEMTDRTIDDMERAPGTLELARALADAIGQRTGYQPHVVLSHVDPRKVDVDNDIDVAAQSNPFGEQAWTEYHRFIQVAKNIIVRDLPGGLLVDIHGHDHATDRVEIGYLLDGRALQRPDAMLDSSLLLASSIHTLILKSTVPFPEVLRGPTSLGGFLEQAGYATVPSPSIPDAGSDPYFSGGYTITRFGSRDGGTVSAVALYAHQSGLLDNATNQDAFADALTLALEAYLSSHLNIDWSAPLQVRR
jgi:Bacterial Ig-like domain (group 2)